MPDRWVVMAYRGGARIATALGKRRARSRAHGPRSERGAAGRHRRRATARRCRVAVGRRFRSRRSDRARRARRPCRPRAASIGNRFRRAEQLAPDAGAALPRRILFDAHHYTRGLSVVPQGTPTNNTPALAPAGRSVRAAGTAFDDERRPAALATEQRRDAARASARLRRRDLRRDRERHARRTKRRGGDVGAALRGDAGLLSRPAAAGVRVSTPGPSPQSIALIRRHFIDHVRGARFAARAARRQSAVRRAYRSRRCSGGNPSTKTRPRATCRPVLRAAQLFWRAGARDGSASGRIERRRQRLRPRADARRRAPRRLNVRTAQSPTFCRTTNGIFGDRSRGRSVRVRTRDRRRGRGRRWTCAAVCSDIRFIRASPTWCLAKDAPALRLPLVDGAPGPAAYLQTLRTASLAATRAPMRRTSSTATSLLATLARHAVLLAYGAAADEFGRRTLTPPPAGPTKTHVAAGNVRRQRAGGGARARASRPLRKPTATRRAYNTGCRSHRQSGRAAISCATTCADRRSIPIVIELNLKLLEIDGALAELATPSGGRTRIADDGNARRRFAPLRCVGHVARGAASRIAARAASRAGRLDRRLRLGRESQAPSARSRSLRFRKAKPGRCTPTERRRVHPRADIESGRGRGRVAQRASQPRRHAVATARLRSTYRRGALLQRWNCSTACARDSRSARCSGIASNAACTKIFAPLELDRFIAPLRRLAPLVGNSVTAPKPGESLEAIAARNVVDGLALVEASPAPTCAQNSPRRTPAPLAAELDAVMERDRRRSWTRSMRSAT